MAAHATLPPTHEIPACLIEHAVLLTLCFSGRKVNYWEVIRQSLIISGSRLVALSMVTLDLMILGRLALDETADFALAVQFSQIYVVLALGLTVGVNIAFNLRKSHSRTVARSVAGYAIFTGFLLFLMSLVMGFFVTMSKNAQLSYFVLTLGIVPTTLYIALCAMIEASGGASWVFKLTIGAAIANAALDLALVHLGLCSPAVAVALATTIVRLLLLGFVIYGCLRIYRISIAPIFDGMEWKDLFSYGRTEALVGLIFTGGVSFLFAYANARGNDAALALLAIGINFLNIASVIYLGMTRAVANVASALTHRISTDLKGLAIFGLAYVLSTTAVLYAASPVLSWLYLGTVSPELLAIFVIAIWVVAFDGAAMLFITLLRLLDWRAGPPMLRLALIVIGVPLAMVWFDPLAMQPVFAGLLMGNIVAALLAGMLLLYAARQRARKDLHTVAAHQ